MAKRVSGGCLELRQKGTGARLVCEGHLSFFLERRLFPVTTRATQFKKRTTKSPATVKPDKLKIKTLGLQISLRSLCKAVFRCVFNANTFTTASFPGILLPSLAIIQQIRVTQENRLRDPFRFSKFQVREAIMWPFYPVVFHEINVRMVKIRKRLRFCTVTRRNEASALCVEYVR